MYTQNKPLRPRVTVSSSLSDSHGGLERIRQTGQQMPASVGRHTTSRRRSVAKPLFHVKISPLRRKLFSRNNSLPAPSLSNFGTAAVGPTSALEEALHEMHQLAQLPDESSIESSLELIVSDRAQEHLLLPSDGWPTPNVKDVSALTAFYESPAQPLSVVLLSDRDLAFRLDPTKGEVSIEATEGEQRVVVVVGNYYRRHQTLGPHEGDRVVFTGLAPNSTYVIGLLILRSPDTLVEQAERISVSGTPLEALALVERALALNPRLPHAWRRKAYILRELGRAQEALSAAGESIRLDPGYALGLRCKGAILRDLGEHQLGLECYERSLALDPTDSICWANKGNALSALGRKREARKAYAEGKRIAALHPERR